ncbi:helix-turn-helix domain-containing protein, partial [Lactiplantibacillus plantarum]|uniref:helix-turn-helix domain-containing protein n=1 Tax=Lactiplantibacillus plantarum TaxID=1590 RepID=UPI00203ADE74
MSPYNHLTLKDRECILLGVTLNDTYQVIAEKIGCSKATVSREIKRNGGRKAYSAVKAQENYQGRRLKSRRPRLLTDLKLRDFVLHCIVQRQWSPEQISGRLVHENSEWHVSYNTIYRGIERDNLGIKRKNHEARGFARKLRHRGKTRKVT